jgi:4-aminobutyrate aminotransferase-like enzyme
MIFAKGVANGFPLSGIVASKDLMDKMDVGGFGGTYAGNAVACAAGVAAQEVYASGEIEENVAKRYVMLQVTFADVDSLDPLNCMEHYTSCKTVRRRGT